MHRQVARLAQRVFLDTRGHFDASKPVGAVQVADRRFVALEQSFR
jgi:hypothetical protein